MITILSLKWLLIISIGSLLGYYFNKDFTMFIGIVAFSVSMIMLTLIPFLMKLELKDLKKINRIFHTCVIVSVSWLFFLNIDRINIALVVFMYIVSNIIDRSLRNEFLKKYQPHILDLED